MTRPQRGKTAVDYLFPMPIRRLFPLLLLAAACGKTAERGNPACGLAALAGPTALLTQFSVPRQTLSKPPTKLPERLVARVVAGPALPAIVGRSDSLLVIGVEGTVPATVKPGYGVLVLDTAERPRGVMLFEGNPVEGAPPIGTVSLGSETLPLIGIAARSRPHRRPTLPVLPGLGAAVSAPRIAVGGVVRTWDAAERTGRERGLRALGARRRAACRSSCRRYWGRPSPCAALDGIDGLVLTGGEDIHPAWYGAEPSPQLYPPSRERDLFELALFAAARQRELPILGICRGIQLVNVALGGTLFQDLPSERPGPVAHDPGGDRDARTHEVRLQEGSRAARALGADGVQRELVPSPGGGSIWRTG